jgi:hypothetical protein
VIAEVTFPCPDIEAQVSRQQNPFRFTSELGVGNLFGTPSCVFGFEPSFLVLHIPFSPPLSLSLPSSPPILFPFPLALGLCVRVPTLPLSCPRAPLSRPRLPRLPLRHNTTTITYTTTKPQNPVLKSLLFLSPFPCCVPPTLNAL